jgi:hypothetical protein
MKGTSAFLFREIDDLSKKTAQRYLAFTLWNLINEETFLPLVWITGYFAIEKYPFQS